MSLGNFAGSFLSAYTAAQLAKRGKKENDEEIKAKTKLFELQVAREQRLQQEADQKRKQQQEFFDTVRQKMQIGRPTQMQATRTDGTSAGMLEDPRPQLSLPEMLADPEMLLGSMQAGVQLPQVNDPALTFDQRKELALAGRSQGVTVNTGDGMPKPPPGYVRTDPSRPGLMPEPGGPAAREVADTDAKRLQRAQRVIDGADNVLTAAQEARGLVGFNTVGLAGSRMAKVEGTDAFDLATKISTIKANLGVDAIQQMREASPTGGALGNTSNVELDQLQSKVASLNQGMSEKAFKSSLDKIEYHYARWKEVAMGGTEALPEGIPDGSRRIGTSGGKPVYETPDGKLLIVE